MVRIIDGKRYDSEKARIIGTWNNGKYAGGDFVCETLHRKKNGEYFLHGEGGPATRYAVSSGNNMWRSGEAISPMAFDAAKEWAEKNLSAEEYEAEFGAVSEDGGQEIVSVSLPASLLEKLRRKSRETGVPVSKMISDATEKLV